MVFEYQENETIVCLIILGILDDIQISRKTLHIFNSLQCIKIYCNVLKYWNLRRISWNVLKCTCLWHKSIPNSKSIQGYSSFDFTLDNIQVKGFCNTVLQVFRFSKWGNNQLPDNSTTWNCVFQQRTNIFCFLSYFCNSWCLPFENLWHRRRITRSFIYNFIFYPKFQKPTKICEVTQQ